MHRNTMCMWVLQLIIAASAKLLVTIMNVLTTWRKLSNCHTHVYEFIYKVESSVSDCGIYYY